MAFVKRLIRALTLRKYRKQLKARRALQAALRNVSCFPRTNERKMHPLPAKLIVSLTSYPPRFGTLSLTIKSLLDQSMRPDQLILWVGQAAMALLPRSVTDLEGPDFAIRPTEDLRSFTKIVPALIAYPEAFIVVADDDVYYPSNWLEQLADAFDPSEPAIVYHRGHRLTHLPDGQLAPYRSWQREVIDRRSLLPSTDVMPTGVGGVLYPPGSLSPQTTDVPLLKRLSETCDDSWLYFMWRRNGWKAKRVPGPKQPLVTWPDTQEQSLMTFHRGGKKDEHLRALSEHFGTP